MTSRIDVIASNGNDGLHYEDEDLNWLARNVHEWKDDLNYLSVDRANNAYVFHRDNKHGATWFTKQQWLDKRAELQNKPRFKDHQDAKCFVQNDDGYWYKNTTTSDVKASDNSGWNDLTGVLAWEYVCKGEVLGDWRNTLEKRPEQRKLNPPTSSNIHAQAIQQAKETGLCSDGKECGVIDFANDGYCNDCPNQSNTSQTNETVYSPEGWAYTPNHTEQHLDMGTKHDNDKPRMDLIPPTAERLLAQVLSYGAEKYAPDNWRKVPDAKTRYIAAAMRHINAHRSGEVIDEESGLPHLAHAMCSLAFILELDYERITP